MKRKPLAVFYLSLCLSLAAAGHGQIGRGGDLKAGVARVELHPPVNFGMAGYGARTGNSEGFLDALQAKVLVLEGKDRAVAFVTMDLAAVFPDEQLEQIRSRAKSEGIDDVVFSCSHTHSGPNVAMEDPPEWQNRAVADIGAAIEEAWKARVPSRFGIGQGSCYIGHNRLGMMSEGSGKMLWRNETRIRTSPVDPTVMILRLDRNDGSPLAILVNYACHPVVLGPENVRYSADYPGEMMRVVESSLGGNASCMFLQGACGDINPYYDKTPVAENAVALMQETGRKLAGEVLKVAKSTRTKAAPDSEIRIARETLAFKPRWNKDKILERLSGASLTPYMKRRIDRMLRETYPTPLTLVLFNRDFAFVGVPAEIFVDYQLELRERIVDFPVLFGGYTNGNLAYIPTIRGAVNGGYGASEMGAILEIGAGDRLIDRAVIQLGHWTGKLKSAPDTPTN